MIKSGFYDTSDGMTSENVHVLSHGVPRSATTMLYQVLRAIYPDGGVVKCHRFLDVNVPAGAARENFDGSPLVLSVPHAHPQQEPAVLELLLETMSVLVAN